MSSSARLIRQAVGNKNYHPAQLIFLGGGESFQNFPKKVGEPTLLHFATCSEFIQWANIKILGEPALSEVGEVAPITPQRESP